MDDPPVLVLGPKEAFPYGFGIARGSIVEKDPLAEVKGVGFSVLGDFPALRKHRGDFAVFLDLHEVFVEVVLKKEADDGRGIRGGVEGRGLGGDRYPEFRSQNRKAQKRKNQERFTHGVSPPFGSVTSAPNLSGRRDPFKSSGIAGGNEAQALEG